ncbi:MAG: transposase [Rickettsiales bacterium]|nr:transposase [Rickettsiales bacterium]
MVGKIPVVGIKSRKGQVRAFAVEATDTKALTGAIRENAAEGSEGYTDQWEGYKGLKGIRAQACQT